MSRRLAGFGTTLALQVVALVLAHELVFLARYGSRYGEALAHSGHGETWASAVTASLALTAALVIAGTVRLAHLGVLLRGVDAAAIRASARRPAGSLEVRGLARIWLRIAPRLAFLTVLLLSLQENLERSSLGTPLPGPGILLSPEYPSALWIALGVSLLVGFVAALFEWRRRALAERLRAARAVLPRRAPVRPQRPHAAPARNLESVLGRRSGRRAPPASSAA